MLGVLGVMGAGMVGVARNLSPRQSNLLMRARVALQGTALVLIALLLLLRSR